MVGALGLSIAFYRISVKNHRLSESNALLVREQNHRVKNNLQLVSSLLNLQLNRLTDDATKNVLEETQLRIEVMSVLQRTLYTGFGMRLIQLQADQLYATYQFEKNNGSLFQIKFKVQPT